MIEAQELVLIMMRPADQSMEFCTFYPPQADPSSHPGWGPGPVCGPRLCAEWRLMRLMAGHALIHLRREQDSLSVTGWWSK